jgi:hypothetical protein
MNGISFDCNRSNKDGCFLGDISWSGRPTGQTGRPDKAGAAKSKVARAVRSFIPQISLQPHSDVVWSSQYTIDPSCTVRAISIKQDCQIILPTSNEG